MSNSNQSSNRHQQILEILESIKQGFQYERAHGPTMSSQAFWTDDNGWTYSSGDYRSVVSDPQGNAVNPQSLLQEVLQSPDADAFLADQSNTNLIYDLNQSLIESEMGTPSKMDVIEKPIESIGQIYKEGKLDYFADEKIEIKDSNLIQPEFAEGMQGMLNSVAHISGQAIGEAFHAVGMEYNGKGGVPTVNQNDLSFSAAFMPIQTAESFVNTPTAAVEIAPTFVADAIAVSAYESAPAAEEAVVAENQDWYNSGMGQGA
jgi:hypothetical protein